MDGTVHFGEALHGKRRKSLTDNENETITSTGPILKLCSGAACRPALGCEGYTGRKRPRYTTHTILSMVVH